MKRAAVVELLAFRAESGRTRRVSVEGRDFYSLSYRYDGKVLLKTEEGELISEANSITFMPKGIGYETEILEDTRMAVVHFKLNGEIPWCRPDTTHVQGREIPLLFERLIQSFRVDNPQDFYSMSIFYELLAKLEARIPSEGEERIPRKIAEAREGMRRRFSDPCFSITTLADDLGISTSYLRREFSRAYGKNPSTFLRDLRIENAKHLLQSEYLSIARIGEQSGFSCESYFIQVFHKVTGTSPDRYRQGLYKK